MAINMSEVFYDWYSVEAKGTWDRSTQTLRAFISKIIVRIEAATAARGAGRRSAGTPNNTLHPALVFFSIEETAAMLYLQHSSTG